MKRLAFKILAPTILLGLFSAARSYAQIEYRVDVNVPFSFYAGSTLLPAGSYTISPLAGAPLSLLVRSENEKVAVMIETVPAEVTSPPKECNLVFDELAGKHFLSMIWVDGSNMGYQVLPSPMHQQLLNKQPQHSHRSAKASHIKKEK